MSEELVKQDSNLAVKGGYDFNEHMSLAQMKSVAQEILDSGLCPHFSEVEQVITVATMGKSMGFDLMTSLNNIDNIQGKPTLSYRAVGAVLHMNGYAVNWLRDKEDIYDQNGQILDWVTEVEIIDTNLLEKYKAEMKNLMEYPEDIRSRMLDMMDEWKAMTRRRMTYKWSDAVNAGYSERSSWKKMPREMLRARCLVSAVRALCPHVMMGFYETTEIADNSFQTYEVPDTAEVNQENPIITNDVKTEGSTTEQANATSDIDVEEAVVESMD